MVRVPVGERGISNSGLGVLGCELKLVSNIIGL